MARSKRKWVLVGALLASTLLSWASAIVVTRIAARFLALPEGEALADLSGATFGEPDVEAESPGEPRRSRPTARSRSYWIDPIIKRSVFDSSKIGAESAEVGPQGDERKSDLKVVLLATVVAEPEQYSSALIAEEKSEEGALGYGIGDMLLGEAEVIKIEQRKVYVRRSDGSLEYIAMDEGVGYIKEGGTKAADGEGDDVEKLGDNKFVVERSVLDQALENPEKLASQIRVVPHKGENGEIDGYRLSGIRRKSLFYQLGIKNGDVVHSVNGRELNSVQAAMDAYNELQSESSFNFDISRRNKRQTFEYEVR